MPLLSLPIEIQSRIFFYTDLVLPIQPPKEPQGLVLRDSRLVKVVYTNGYSPWYEAPNEPRPTRRLPPFPTHLFLINRHLSLLARKVVFRENRFILDSVRPNTAWLEAQPIEMLQLIRHMDIREQFSGPSQSPSPLYPAYPPEYLHALALLHRLNLPGLTLCVDTAYNLRTWNREVQYYYEWLPERAREYFRLYKAANLHTLKDFFVFMPVYRSIEKEAEEMVMGEDYDSVSRGKIPFRHRSWTTPHGWEGDFTEFVDDMDDDGPWKKHQIALLTRTGDVEPYHSDSDEWTPLPGTYHKL